MCGGAPREMKDEWTWRSSAVSKTGPLLILLQQKQVLIVLNLQRVTGEKGQRLGLTS